MQKPMEKTNLFKPSRLIYIINTPSNTFPEQENEAKNNDNAVDDEIFMTYGRKKRKRSKLEDDIVDVLGDPLTGTKEGVTKSGKIIDEHIEKKAEAQGKKLSRREVLTERIRIIEKI